MLQHQGSSVSVVTKL